jgi:hypothetical protein
MRTDSDDTYKTCTFVCRFVEHAHLRTNATRMRIDWFVLSMTLLASGCGGSPDRVAIAEQSAMRSEQRLARADESYDLSEQDIARMRVAVNDIVERGRLAAHQLEMAARDYEYATFYHYMTSDQLTRAAAAYQNAAETYRQVATLIVQLASSERLLQAICGRTISTQRYRGFLDVYGVTLDEKGIDHLIPRLLGKEDRGPPGLEGPPLDVPLPVLNGLAKRAARMLLCAK